MPKFPGLPPAHRHVAASLFLLPLACAAQDAANNEGLVRPEPSSLQRVEVVARQSATELRRAARQAKQIVGREELDRFGDSNILDVLRRQPGVSIGSDGPSLRGLSARYTQILINGDPAPAGFSIDQLHPAQIERIEILRTPTAEQSSQAVAGSINVILKNTPRRSQRSLQLTLNDGRKHLDPDLQLTVGESQGPLAFTLPIYFSDWEREYNRADIERRGLGADGQLALGQHHSRFVAWGVIANAAPRLNWELGPDHRLSLSAFLQKLNWNAGIDTQNRVITGQPPEIDDLDLHRDTYNRNAQASWSKGLADDQRLELRAGLQQSSWRLANQSFDDSGLRTRTLGSGRAEGLTQSGKYNRLLGEDHALSLGWDLERRELRERRDAVDANGQPLAAGFEGQPYEARVLRQAFYVQDEWELTPRWQLYLGLRHERIQTRGQAMGAGAAPLSASNRVNSPVLSFSHKFDARGRQLLRASLSRSYRAADLNLMLARPVVSVQFPHVEQANTPNAPDRLGNPALKPELATGLDVAYEHYGAGGAMFSLGLFHRRLEGVVRQVLSLRDVPWASVPRWVSEPQNFSNAQTSGLELEAKGRASDLLPQRWADSPRARALSLRATFSAYRSRVQGLPGPDNRLDGQAPWTASFGFDQAVSGMPLTLGASLSLSPGYSTQLTENQRLDRSRTRVSEIYGKWQYNRQLSLRLTAKQGALPWGGPPNQISTQWLPDDAYNRTDRRATPNYALVIDMRL